MSELIHRHDEGLEHTLLACVFAYPDCVGEPWANLSDDVFYLQSCRDVWGEVVKQYREHGAFDLSTIAAAFIERGQGKRIHETLTRCVGVFEGNYHPSSAYAKDYARRLQALYIVREKGKAALRYQQAIAKGEDQGEAKLELDAVLSILDSAVQDYDERSDEELALLIGDGARLATGYVDFDNLCGGMASPGLNVLAARPSIGKSSLARGIIRNVAKKGLRVLWYSQDQSENQILELEIARYLRCDTQKVRKMSSREVADAIRAVRGVAWNGCVTLVDTPTRLPNLVTLAKTHLPDLMVIDYLQQIATGHSDEYERVSAVSATLKELAFSLRIPILAIAQFNRGFENGKIPSMSNLRGSGQIEQDADQIWALDRDTNLSTTERQQAKWHVLKNKVGATGSVVVQWEPHWASYESAARGHF